MDGLSARDLRLLGDALDAALEPEPDQLIAQQILDEIARLVRCDDVTLQVMNYTNKTMDCQSSLDVEEPDPWRRAMFWSSFWDSICSHPQRTGDTAIIWSGYLPPAGPDGGVMMREYDDLSVSSDEMLVPLTGRDGDDHRILLFRQDGRFSERDVLVMSLIRARIGELHVRQVFRRSGAQGLTARQVEILRLVAAGSTNRQIARALEISEATARTHLTNIYTKLGATNRTQALASAGLLS